MSSSFLANTHRPLIHNFSINSLRPLRLRRHLQWASTLRHFPSLSTSSYSPASLSIPRRCMPDRRNSRPFPPPRCLVTHLHPLLPARLPFLPTFGSP